MNHSFCSFRNCDQHSLLCEQMSVMYAWGRNAPALHLPNGNRIVKGNCPFNCYTCFLDVGFRIGGSSSINFLILQVHYSHTLLDDETDSSGVTLHYTFSP